MKIRAGTIFFFVSLLLTSCTGGSGGATPAPATAVAQTPAGVEPTATSFQPPPPEPGPSATPTAVPLAMVVNGEPVTLDEFNRALQRFHAGVPEASSEEAIERVSSDYIDQILLAQAAIREGYVLSEAGFQERLAALVDDAGGNEALETWLADNFYTRDLFESDLRRSIAAAWMRDRIAAAVPTSAEQVRARQVRVTNREEAETVLAQLNGGTGFDVLARVYDPEGLGELGWFPRGLLFEPAVEDAAFALAVGDYSGVIETGVGFHIIQVTDRAADRPLDPDALWALQSRALEEWLIEQRAGSEIELFVP